MSHWKVGANDNQDALNALKENQLIYAALDAV